MVDRKRLLRGGSRIAIGAGLTVAGALLITNLGLVPIPELTREITSLTVDTEQDSLRSVVCQGPFGELGTDPSNPAYVRPVGSATMLTSPNIDAETPLEIDGDAEQSPVAYRSSSVPPASAAQMQRVSTSGVKGLAANACLEPTNEQWLVGGSTDRGFSSTLTVANPGDVPATVRVTMYDETGEESSSSSGMLVPAGAQRTVSLNGYAVGRQSPVVHVVSSGSPVTSVLGVAQIIDIDPVGADNVTAQPAPSTQLVFPGVINYTDHFHAVDDEHTEDEFPVSVRLFAPGMAAGSAEITGLTEHGERIHLADAEILSGVVTDTQITLFPEEVTAMLITSDIPVVGGVFSSVHDENDHDFAWHTPAPRLEAGETVSTVLLAGGETTLVNLGAEPAVITVSEDLNDDGEVEIEPGAAMRVELPRTAQITSTQPIAGAVSLFPGESMSSYPLVAAPERFGSLRVYTR